MVAIGGWGHFWGPLFGAALFTAVPELLHQFQDTELLVFGAGMIGIMLFLPGGVASISERMIRRLRRSGKNASAKPAAVEGSPHGVA